MKNIFFKSIFYKNLSVLVFGTFSAQLLAILFSPVLSRVYSPYQFGILGSILAISGFISSFSSLKYEMSLILENDNYKMKLLQDLSIYILIFIIGLFIIILKLNNNISSYFLENNIIELNIYLLFCVLIIFFNGLINIYNARLNREELFNEISLFVIVRRFSLVVSQLFLGFCGFTTVGLIIGNIFSSFISICILFVRKQYIFIFNTLDFNSLKLVALRYKKFPIYSAPQSILNSFFVQLPIIFLGLNYNIEVLGAYFFAVKIIQLPSNMIGQSVRKVFYREASKIKNKINKLKFLYFKLTFILFLLIIIPIFVIFLFGESLFIIIFGNNWSLAGEFSEWLILWFGAVFVMSPTRALFFIFEKQKELLIFDLSVGFFRTISMVLVSLFYDYITIIAI